MRSPVFRRRVSATCGDGGGAPRKCHPGGGGRLSSHHTTTRYTADTQYTILGATAPHPSGVRFGGCPSAVPACRHDPAWRNTGLRTAATTSGVALWGAHRWSPHVADAQVGEIRGYARLQPLAGLGKCPPLVIVSAVGGEADSALRPTTALRGCTFGTHYICIV